VSDGWEKEAERRIEDLLSELAREGKLSRDSQPGMLLHATIVIEYVGADKGEDWHSILNLPNDRVRDVVYHRWMLDKYLHDNVGDPNDEEAP
jgi:hypothetical protein